MAKSKCLKQKNRKSKTVFRYCMDCIKKPAASTFNKHMLCVWFHTRSPNNSYLRCAVLCRIVDIIPYIVPCSIALHGFSSCRRLFHNLLNRNLFQVLQVKRGKTNLKMFSLEMKQQNEIEYFEEFSMRTRKFTKMKII